MCPASAVSRTTLAARWSERSRCCRGASPEWGLTPLLEAEAQFVHRVVLELDAELAATGPAGAGLPVVDEAVGGRIEADARRSARRVVERHGSGAAAGQT